MHQADAPSHTGRSPAQAARQHAAISTMKEKIVNLPAAQQFAAAVERVPFADAVDVDLHAGLEKPDRPPGGVECDVLAADPLACRGDFIGGGHRAGAAKEPPRFGERSGG